MVLTGDSLLVGDVGRPDFGGGDAAAQYESLTRLLRLPDWVAVFPGHFEGPCGKGMCGRPSTTIGFERLYNPLARLDREPFVAQLTDGVPARPLNMTAIEATNRGVADHAWAMLTTEPGGRRDRPRRAGERGRRTRCCSTCASRRSTPQGHVPGAVNLPQADLAARLRRAAARPPDPHDLPGRIRSLRAAQFLKQMGFEQVASVAGGTAAWAAGGKTAPRRRSRSQCPTGHRDRVGPRRRIERRLTALRPHRPRVDFDLSSLLRDVLHLTPATLTR